MPVIDAAIAVALVVAALISVSNSGGSHRWAELAAVGAVAPIALRSRSPLTMAICSSICISVYAMLPGASAPLWAFLAVLVICFSTGLGLDGWPRLLMVAALLASSYILQFHTAALGGDAADLWFTPLVLVGLPAVAGDLLQRSRRQTASVQRLTMELAAEREHHTEEAVLAERRRIARELHDVISHSVSIMVVQAGAAAQLLQPDAAAREPIRAIRETGKEALGELRRQLGVLNDIGAAELAPLPGLAEIPDLAASSGASLTVKGTWPRVVPAGLALTAFRIVQEALTNVRRHAPGAEARVEVAHRLGLIEILVEDSGGTGRNQPMDDEQPGGNGVRGMRERVELYGGTLDAGPRPDRAGWRVFAEIPVPVTTEAGR